VLKYGLNNNIVKIMRKTVAVVDDEPDILELIELHLRKAGFETIAMEKGQELFEFIKKRIPDLIILDLMLPDMDGLEICRYLRKDNRVSDVPIIMLTARSDEIERVTGLELGADDYVTKPFSVRELVARVKASFRREKRGSVPGHISLGGVLEIYPDEYRVEVNGKEIELTSTEFRILVLLASNKGKVYTRQDILDTLWGINNFVIDRTIDVHITNLRKKMGMAGKFIVNRRGIGYKLKE